VVAAGGLAFAGISLASACLDYAGEGFDEVCVEADPNEADGGAASGDEVVCDAGAKAPDVGSGSGSGSAASP
jgi:hypothetical protein